MCAREKLWVSLAGLVLFTGCQDDLVLKESGGEAAGFGLSSAAADGFLSFVDGTGAGTEPLNTEAFVTPYTSPDPDWVDTIEGASWELLRYDFYRVDIEGMGLALNEAISENTHNNQMIIRLFPDVEITLETSEYDFIRTGSVFWYGESASDGAANSQVQISGDFMTSTIVHAQKTYHIWTETSGSTPVVAVVELDGAQY